jgi:hypothetical protein
LFLLFNSFINESFLFSRKYKFRKILLFFDVEYTSEKIDLDVDISFFFSDIFIITNIANCEESDIFRLHDVIQVINNKITDKYNNQLKENNLRETQNKNYLVEIINNQAISIELLNKEKEQFI